MCLSEAVIMISGGTTHHDAALRVWPVWIANSRTSGTGLRSRCHRLRGDLGSQLRRALQGQAAKIAADQEVSPQRNHRNKEKGEPASRLHGGEYGRAGALGAGVLNLLDRLRLRPHSKQKKHFQFLTRRDSESLCGSVKLGRAARGTRGGVPAPHTAATQHEFASNDSMAFRAWQRYESDESLGRETGARRGNAANPTHSQGTRMSGAPTAWAATASTLFTHRVAPPCSDSGTTGHCAAR